MTDTLASTDLGGLTLTDALSMTESLGYVFGPEWHDMPSGHQAGVLADALVLLKACREGTETFYPYETDPRAADGFVWCDDLVRLYRDRIGRGNLSSYALCQTGRVITLGVKIA